jgi:hypothetical protein
MDKSSVWGSSRFIALLVVLVLHLGVIVLLVMGSRTSTVFASDSPRIELIFLPLPQPEKMRADNARPRRMRAEIAISSEAPALNLPAASAPGSGSSDDFGAGINWAAEAHRAIQAFEIRRDEHVTHATLGLSPWDGWLPPREHVAGERFKTPSGDWIVWLDANCYQVASWHAGAPPQETTQPQTICTANHSTAHSDPPDPAATSKPPRKQ